MVLAGDPKQLGPILRSPLAIQYGLGETADYLMSPVVLSCISQWGFSTSICLALLDLGFGVFH